MKLSYTIILILSIGIIITGCSPTPSEFIYIGTPVEDGIAIIKSPMDNYKVIPKEKTDRLKAFILDTGIDLDSLVPRIDTDDSNSE